MYRDGDFRVWDLKTEKPVLGASLTPTPVVGNDEEDEDMGGGFICMSAPRTLDQKKSVDMVAVGASEQIVLVPCRPPPPEAGGGMKKLTDNAVSRCCHFSITRMDVFLLYQFYSCLFQ